MRLLPHAFAALPHAAAGKSRNHAAYNVLWLILRTSRGSCTSTFTLTGNPVFKTPDTFGCLIYFCTVYQAFEKCRVFVSVPLLHCTGKTAVTCRSENRSHYRHLYGRVYHSTCAGAVFASAGPPSSASPSASLGPGYTPLLPEAEPVPCTGINDFWYKSLRWRTW